MSQRPLLFKGGRVVDPSQKLDGVLDLLLVDGVVAALGENVDPAAGAREIWHTRPGAAHPGGTCAMGKVVDDNLKTRLDNLYVCDASVVPVPFGIPPTLTCLALSKRLGRHLQAELAG